MSSGGPSGDHRRRESLSILLLQLPSSEQSGRVRSTHTGACRANETTTRTVSKMVENLIEIIKGLKKTYIPWWLDNSTFSSAC